MNKDSLRRFFDIACVSGWFLFAPNLHANPEFHPLEDIRQQTENFIRQAHTGATEDLVVTVAALDPRLRLPLCSAALDISHTHASRQLGQTLVTVACPGEKPWNIYVPVTVQIFAEVLVVSRALPPGSLIQSTDVELQRHDLARLSAGYYQTPTALQNLQTKRHLRPGAVLTPLNLVARKLIHSGDKVSLLIETANLQVHGQGQALNDAGVGERVQVRNLQSGRIIEGLVMADGVVKIR